MEKPTAQDIKSARARAGMTLAQSAALVGVSVRAWQYWESGQRAMPASALKLFNITTITTTTGEIMNTTTTTPAADTALDKARADLALAMARYGWVCVSGERGASDYHLNDAADVRSMLSEGATYSACGYSDECTKQAAEVIAEIGLAAPKHGSAHGLAVVGATGFEDGDEDCGNLIIDDERAEIEISAAICGIADAIQSNLRKSA